MALRNTKGLSNEWPKQPTLPLKVTTRNSFPNPKVVNGTYFACFPYSLPLFFLGVSSISHIVGKYFLRYFPLINLLYGSPSRLDN